MERGSPLRERQHVQIVQQLENTVCKLIIATNLGISSSMAMIFGPSGSSALKADMIL